MNSINDLSNNLQEKMNGVNNSPIEQDVQPSEYERAEQKPMKDQSYGQTEQTPPTTPYQPSSQMPPQPVSPQPVPEQKSGDVGIYGNYMEHLIEMALADGELTDKEKQVLFKKAEANGIDLEISLQLPLRGQHQPCDHLRG